MHIIQLKVDGYFIPNAQIQGNMPFIYGEAAGGMDISSNRAEHGFGSKRNKEKRTFREATQCLTVQSLTAVI